MRALYLHGNTALGLPPEVLGPTFFDSTRTNPPAEPLEILRKYFSTRFVYRESALDKTAPIRAAETPAFEIQGQATELLAELRAAEAQARLLRAKINSLKRHLKQVPGP